MTPLVTDEDIEAVSQQMRSQWIGRGTKVVELETVIADWVHAKHCVVLGSGTAALMLANAQGHGGTVTIYPQRGGDIEDFARHLPARHEATLQGRFGVFSFGALKDVSGGIGGALVSNEPIQADHWKRISPLSDINAAMILSQLWRYQGHVEERLVADGKVWRRAA